MRLARLHINGFKSFPDRAELSFDDGVTAIVGPNGCGKSNVVDAITWVLGEQSAKSLRGERMEDVIFNGSDARKPTAAAEVRLKLADVAQAATLGVGGAADVVDEELDRGPILTRDVEIGRRLYRSGESEYLIDGEVCRLRDVHDLLMDSGLGVKAYAVIEQGKIGQILSSRPAERRTLIEEAAGVTKYKNRRRSAELKLEAAQQNLTRIDDIIFEVEKQRGALKRQAAKARRYRRLREELRRWEQVQFAHRHRTLAADIAAAESRLEDARAREAAAAAHLADLEAHLERVRIALAEAESTATADRERAHVRELEIGRRQQQIQFDQQQTEDLGRRVEELAAEASDLEARRDPARTAIDRQREAVLAARQALGDTAARLADREQDYGRALARVQAVEQDADQTRAGVLSAATTLSALRQARDHAAAVGDRVADERGRLDVEWRDLEGEAERARRDGAVAEAALERLRGDLAALTGQRAAAEQDLATRRASREQDARILAAAQRTLAGGEARLRSLEDIEARRATFDDAARFLLAEAPDAVSQHGAIADHLTVERSYERAVDALLGPLLQHIVIDSIDQVARALALLSEHDAGRCGFAVLEDLQAAPTLSGRFGPVAGQGRALGDVVQATGPHAAAIARLLPQAYIVESFDQARALSASVSAPVATLAGEVFRGGGLIEGGWHRGAHGILETRGETAALRDQVLQEQGSTERLARELSAADVAMTDAEMQLASHVEALHREEKTLVGLEGQSARAAEELARVTRRLEVVRTERGRAAEEARAAEFRRDEAVSAIAAHELRQRDADARLTDVHGRLQTARDAAEAELRGVTEVRAEQAALGERVSALDAEAVRLAAAAQELTDRLGARRADIERTEVRRAELRDGIRDSERVLDQEIRELEALRVHLRGLDDQVAASRVEFAEKEHEIRGSRQVLDGVRSQVLKSEVARATAAADLSHLAATCLEAVNASIDDVVAEVARMEEAGELTAPGRRLAAIAAADEADASVELGEDEADRPAPAEAAATPEAGALSPDEVIADLREKIDRLGPVNMMAIEQFDELEHRHTFLTTQRKDLLDSIAQTGEAIRRIDTTTRERFQDAFAMINDHFQRTFATLFGGGRAGLVLIDQDNQVESGIDIIAQPPGKRLQNIQLLSGGEKALTAMALMFAIFAYRPSPFCLLDEIDAPLDDANIGRFVEMLQGMQGHTQFILITHNRKTMEIADRLYGVTMEEPGVSKLISVQMN